MAVSRSRLGAALLLALAAVPGQCIRHEPPPSNDRVGLELAEIPLDPAVDIARGGADIALEQAWEITSPFTGFGSLSGLAVQRSGRLVAVSDQGMRIGFAPPPARPDPVFEAVSDTQVIKDLRDLEAVAIDPAGREWVAFEGADKLASRASAREPWRYVETPATADWPANGGAETMTFLAGGELLLVEEATDGDRTARALLYRDPVAEPMRFAFRPPFGYRATDAATLPDGRVLILLRGLRIMPPGFLAKIVLADPEAIREGAVWSGVEIARIAAPAPVDNMEGIAVAPRPDGALDVWLVSDDNGVQLQRTVLMRLRYRPPPRG